MEIISTLLHTLIAVGAAVTIFVGNIVDTYTPSSTVVSVAPTTKIVLPPPPRVYVPPTPPTLSAPADTNEDEELPAATPVTSAAVSDTASTPPATTISTEDLNTKVRSALVNVLCITHSNKVHPISGSGVFISSSGVVLTNAHVGQFFLLKDYPTKDDVECVLRTGSPAKATYRAKLLYLPPAWIEENASQIALKEAKGTGENDYAFLLVTEAIEKGVSLPKSFPALPMTLQEPKLEQNMLLAAYPAGFLDGTSIQKNLYITSAYAAVKKLFTFGDEREVDLVSIGGTVVSQGGSSGGATVRAYDGRLQGIITTATSADTTAGRDLRTITLGHVDRSLIMQGKGGLQALLTQDPQKAAEKFEDSIAPEERAALLKALKTQ